jgi:hypothetical protein
MKKKVLGFTLAIAMLVSFLFQAAYVGAAITQPPVSFTIEQLKTDIDLLQIKPFVSPGNSGASYSKSTGWAVEADYNYTTDFAWNSVSGTKYAQWNATTSVESDMAFISDGWAVDVGVSSSLESAFPTIVQIKPSYNTTAGRLVFIAPYSGIFKVEGSSLFPDIKAPAIVPNNTTYNSALDANPIKFRITVNNVKIWPTDADYVYFRIGDQVAMPTLNNLALSTNDKIAFECYNPFPGYNTLNGGHTAASDVYLNLKPIVTFTDFSIPTDYSPLSYRQLMIDQFNAAGGYNPPVGAWAPSAPVTFTEDYAPWFTQVDYGDGFISNASSIIALDGNGIPSRLESYGYLWTKEWAGGNNVGFVDAWGAVWARINATWAATPNNMTTTTSLSFKAPSAGKYSILPEDTNGYIKAQDTNMKFRIVKANYSVNGWRSAYTKVWPTGSDYQVIPAGTQIDVPTLNNIYLNQGEILALQTVNDTGASVAGNLYIRAKIRLELKLGTLGVSQTPYLTNIVPGKTVADVLAQIAGYTSIGFKTKTGTTITDNGTAVTTGTTVTIGINATNTEYTVVIKGDVDGSGTIALNDLATIKSHLLQISPLSGAYLMAGGITTQGKIGISDLLAVKKHVLGISLIS